MPSEEKQKWKVKVKGGYKFFPSLEAAQSYRRKMEEKGIFIPWITRTAQSNASENWVDHSLEKSFMVESLDYSANVQETGSAFSIGNGYFITCAHVVKSYDKNTESQLDFSQYRDRIKVYLIQDGQQVPAEVIAYDGTKDLAILKSNVQAEAFAFDPTISIGEEVIAVGSPHGFENNVSFGHVSSTDNEIYSYKGAPLYMFVDLSIFPGNSGGPIVNRNTGKVVGVVTAIVAENDNYGLNAGILAGYVIEFCKKHNVEVLT